MLEWIVPGMAKSKYILTMCWCHHEHSCTAGDGGLTNKMSNGFKHFYYYYTSSELLAGCLPSENDFIYSESGLIDMLVKMPQVSDLSVLHPPCSQPLLLHHLPFFPLLALLWAHIHTQPKLWLFLCALPFLQVRLSAMYQLVPPRVAATEGSSVDLKLPHVFHQTAKHLLSESKYALLFAF